MVPVANVVSCIFFNFSLFFQYTFYNIYLVCFLLFDLQVLFIFFFQFVRIFFSEIISG